MVAALFSNPNWDDEKNDRGKRLEELEENFKKAVELVYAPEKQKQVEEIDWDNPFWSAARRAYEAKGIEVDDSSIEKLREDPDRVDQLEQRRKARKELDQTR